MASSSAVVDLCGDKISIPTAIIPQTSTVDPFERSCDNPECSAPKLIAQVPKRDTSEFITDPVLMDQPTLINGFTTVFQIDGATMEMENLRTESLMDESDPNQKPKTIFRVVPNTHAHIVNYVVVDAAGDTMQKIKANDPETIRKLLVSQKLSAEQMLKKLIGKSYDLQAGNISMPMSSTPATLPVPTVAPVLAPAPVFTTAPVCMPTPVVPPAPVSTSAPVLATAPLPTPVHVSASKPTLGTQTSNAKMNAIPSTSTPKAAQPTLKVPSGLTIKFVPNSEIQKTPASSSTANLTKKSSVLNKEQPKKLPVLQNSKTTPLKTAIKNESPTRTPAASGHIFSTKPVVWQALTPKNLTQNAPNVPPKLETTLSPKKITTATIKVSATPQQLPTKTKPLAEPDFLEDLEKSITATAISVVNRNVQKNSQSDKEITKRKLSSPEQVPEAIKKLRPNPNRAQMMTPLPTKKLPTLPVLHKPQSQIKVKKDLMSERSTILFPPVTISTKSSLSQPDPNKNDDNLSQQEHLNSPTRRKNKPLMGPASKMRELRSIAQKKSQQLPSGSEHSLKIGDTIITPKRSESSGKTEVLTKPCSVAITDIIKGNVATDSDNDSRTSRSRRTGRSLSSDKEASKSTKSSDRLLGKRINEDEKSIGRTTRSSATLKTSLTKNKTEPDDDLIDSTLLTSPSAPSRVMKVVLPSKKNNVVNSSQTSPHPNLKISSVISSTLALPSVAVENADSEDQPIYVNEDSNESGIEQLQKELAELRRTVARLTHGKK